MPDKTIDKYDRLKAAPRKWLNALEQSGTVKQIAFALYGHDLAIMKNKTALLKDVLRTYKNQLGEKECILLRAPARINLMGRHIDRQGGHCNYMAIPRDLFVLASPRDDRMVFLHNIESGLYPPRRFDMAELIPPGAESWQQVLDRTADKTPKGDWSAYVKALFARFVLACPDLAFKGMDLFVAGDIPVAGGLSSSSALVVAVAEALAAINGLDIPDTEFIRLCGESEWYVGTRGGFGDHAAMKCAQKGMVSHMAFCPFRLLSRAAFPEKYSLLVAHSRIFAFKSDRAQKTFNQRLECYHIGRKILLEKYTGPIKPSNLTDFVSDAVPAAAVYRLLLALPHSAPAEQRNASGRNPGAGPRPVRGVVLFGLAEEARSRRWVHLLQDQKMQQLGALMNISHDGDRVTRTIRDGRAVPWFMDYGNKSIQDLEYKARRKNSSADLFRQPGAYRCSVREIDTMVDLISATPGVLGAQISGAGLGGCMMALVHRNAYKKAENILIEKYYNPLNLKAEIFDCIPVAGSGPVALPKE